MKTAATSRVIAALVVGVLLAALLFVIPAPAGFSPQGWHLLGVLVPIVIIWATEVMPVGVASLLLLTVVCVAGISTPDVAFSGFANHLCWLMLGAFILADAMMASGLSRRMALWLLSKAKSVNSLEGMAFLANLLMAPVPSATARCSILGPLLDAIMESLGRPSRSNLARYLVYAYLMACTGFTGVMILTSGAANGATLAFYEQMTGNTLSFIQWAGLMILPAAFICLCALVIARFFA
ncbi:MAG: anion permease, partial [Coriobacteriales bacterium]|nr:anion permease [Coriobacteriales bacterium]